jgi:LCP family protein required for cell wall assembly
VTISSLRDRVSRPALAALLSFLWPGLGQAYLRESRAAALFAVPALLLAVYVGAQLLGGVELFAVQLIDPAFAVAVIAWTLIVGTWRMGSIGHTWLLGSAAERASRGLRGAVIALLVAVVAMHGVIGYYAFAFYEAGSDIFEPPPGDSEPPPVAETTPTPTPTFTLAPGATPTPVPTPRPPTNRITFLLIGVDSGHNRNHALTDTLLVVSIDTVDKTVAMISLPRDLSDLPMYSGGTYYDKINSLLTIARQNPSRFPDGPTGTLTREIGFLIGMPIDYYAQINLEGFEQMINLVGGVDVDNPRWIRDGAYDWFDGTYGFTLSPGRHHLDGRLALAYVRSRQGIGDNDFTRARRQQQVIVSLRNRMTQPALIQRLPEILRVAGRTVRTDFPADQVDEFVALGREIGDDRIQQVVLGPPYAYRPTVPRSTYVLLLDFEKVATLSIELFGTDSDYHPVHTGATP